MTKGLVRANNFSDLADKDEAVVNLGLSAADYAALKGLYTTAGIDFAVIGEIGNSQGNYQAQLDGLATTFSGIVLSGYVNRSGNSSITGNWTHSGGYIAVNSGLPSGYPASADTLFSLSIESGEAVIVASGLIASGLSYNGVRQSNSTVTRALPPSGFSPLHLIPLQIGGQAFFAEAGESPSFDIAPALTGNALDLVTGTLLGGGTVNCATPAWEAGPGGILAQPAANSPVIGYDPVTLRPVGLRPVGAVTNLLLQSNTFNTTWAQVNVTVTPNAAQSPDGAANGSTLLVNSAGAALIQGSQSFAAGSTLTVSIFAKKNASNFLRFELGNTVSCWFNLNTGTTGTNQAGSGNVLFSAKSIEPWLNGWYRCFLTVTTTTITTIGVNVFATNTDGASSSVNSSINIFGAQLNTGPPAPYVPTAATSASSTADAIDITSLTGGINSIRTIYARVRTPASGIRGIISLNDNSSSNRLELLTNGTDPRAVAVTSGSTVADIDGGTIAANTTFNIAARFDGDNYAVSINGAPVVTDNAGARAIVDRIFLGRTQAGEYLNGYIERLTTWTTPIGDARLQAITS